MRKSYRRDPHVELIEARVVLSATSCVAECSPAVRSASSFLDTFEVSERPIIVADNSTDTSRELGVRDGSSILIDEYVGRFDTKDVFRFVLPASGLVSIRVHGITADVDLYLLDSNLLTVATSTNWGTEAELVEAELEAGEYFVEVNSYDHFSSTLYSLELQSTLISSTDEAGGTFDTALRLGVIAGTRLIQDYVGPMDKADVFEFHVDSISNVRIDLSSFGGDVDLILFSQDELEIAESQSPGDSHEQIELELAIGTYYVAVTPFDNEGSNYELTIENTTATRTDPPADPPTGPIEPHDPESAPPAPAPSPPAPSPPATNPLPGHPDLVPPEGNPLPDVVYFGGTEEWGINSVAAPEAWSSGYTGQGVTVAIIDSGIQMDHPDLLHSLWKNQDEIPDDGIDNDENGYVDDYVGWDFVESDNTPTDGNNHGTHVAGVVAAGNNDFGSTGVAYAATIMPLRVLDNKGSGSIYNVATAVRYAVDNGADIVNISLGGGNGVNMYTALRYALENDVLVVVAAGNEGAELPGYPARHSVTLANVLSVGAYDDDHQLAAFSNRVGSSKSLQVDAPGVTIYSALIDGRYGYLSGTSMATPYVSGVAALTLSANPNLTAVELRDVLIRGAINSVEGSDSIGAVNAAKTIPLALTIDAASFLDDSTAEPTDFLDVPNTLQRVQATAATDTIYDARISVGNAFPRIDDNDLLESLVAIQRAPNSVYDAFVDDAFVDDAFADDEFSSDLSSPLGRSDQFPG